MTKSELKTGYVVRYRSGELRMVTQTSRGYIIAEMDDDPMWANLEEFNEDLTNKYYNDLDIIEVYGFSTVQASVWKFNRDHRELLWERKEKKRYTYAQLREILGEEFEVVG